MTMCLFQHFRQELQTRFEGRPLWRNIPEDTSIKYGLVDANTLFIDATHVKLQQTGRNQEEDSVKEGCEGITPQQLREEINADREAHEKAFERKDSDDDLDGGSSSNKEQTALPDPESGWFHKGEHKEVFAYGIETACDKMDGYLVIRFTPEMNMIVKPFPVYIWKIKNFLKQT